MRPLAPGRLVGPQRAPGAAVSKVTKPVTAKVRRNPLRGLPPAYDPLIRLWIVRILVFFGGLGALVEGDQITDHWLLHFLGLEATSQSPQPRVAIKHALERLLESLEKSPIRYPTGFTLANNLDKLSQDLGLSMVEQEILLYATACHYSRELGRVHSQLRDIRLSETFHLVGCAIGRSFNAVSEALSPSSRLVSSGLIQVDGEMAFGFEHKVHLLPGLADQLNITHSDPSQLFLSSFHLASAPGLTTDDFKHMGKDLEVLLAYLRMAREAHRPGVNILFYGPPGTGKSQLARAIAQDLGAPLFEVSCQDRYGTVLRGEGRLASYQLAQGVLGGEPQPMVLFDEIEDVFADAQPISFLDKRKRQNGGRKALINQVLEQNRMPAIWITNDLGILDPAFIRRFDVVMELKAPPRSTRVRILERYLQGTSVSAGMRQQLADHPLLAPALVERAAKVVQVVQTIQAPEEVDGILQRLVGNSLEAMGYPRRVRSQGQAPTDYHLSMVNTDWDLNALAQGIHRTGRGSVCLFGVPGSGKSEYGRFLARELDRPLLLHRASDLLAPMVGETEASIARMFQAAEEEGAVLLLDEADSFLRNRTGAYHSWEATMVNEMHAQMEAFNGIFVATTNLFDELDPAVLRRFSAKVEFKPLTPNQRVEMAMACMRKLGLAVRGDALDQLLPLDGLTPGDYATVMRQAELQPIPAAGKFIELLRCELSFKPEGRRRKVGF